MITRRIQDLPTNSAGDRQIEPHQIDDNLSALEGALLSALGSLVISGGVAVAGAVALTGTDLRVQGRSGLTLGAGIPVQVTDLTVSLAALAAGKGRVVIVPTAQTVARTYTDVITSQVLTDQMTTTLGALVVIGAGDAGVTLDAQGYPVCPPTALPVATVTRTGGGATLDLIENPAIVLRGAVPGGSSGLPVGGTVGQVLTKSGAADGAADWETPANAGQVVSPAATVIAIGDSITIGEQAGGQASAWPAVLAAARNWTVTGNAGISGSALSASGRDPMVNRFQAAVPAGYTGHVFLFGGTNDFGQNLALGQPGSTDVGTIYGALRTLVDGIIARLGAGGTLSLITPTWRGDQGHTEGTRNTATVPYTLEQVRQAVRDEAARGTRLYGTRVSLLDAGLALRDWFATDSSNVYMNVDLLHPTQAGQTLLGRWIAERENGADGGSVAPAVPVAIAEYDMLAGANAGVLYARRGPNGTVSGVFGATGLTTSGGTGAQVDMGGLMPTSGVASLTVAATRAGASVVLAALGTTRNTPPIYDTLAPGESGGAWHGYLNSNNGGDTTGPAISGGLHLVTQQVDHAARVARLYVDGALVDTQNMPQDVVFADTLLRIGYWRPEVGQASGWEGTVHWVRVDADLSAGQVSALHGNIRGGLSSRGL